MFSESCRYLSLFVPTADQRERQGNISNTALAFDVDTRNKCFNKNTDQATQLSRETYKEMVIIFPYFIG